jgi:FMN-dependent NADH-azoreductase
MNTILHLTASIFGEGGQSSQLAEQFVACFPGARVLRRDLARDPLPHLDAERFGAFLSRPETRTSAQQRVLDESDALIAELKAADTIVMGLPMYNFGVPSQLKAYLDHIARAGVTFKYTDVQFVYAEGLAIGEAQKQAALEAAQRALRELARPERIAA